MLIILLVRVQDLTRLRENTLPKPGEEPLNNTDVAALTHDISYNNIQKLWLHGKELLDEKHAADNFIIDEVDTLSTDSFMDKGIRFITKK